MRLAPCAELSCNVVLRCLVLRMGHRAELEALLRLSRFAVALTRCFGGVLHSDARTNGNDTEGSPGKNHNDVGSWLCALCRPRPRSVPAKTIAARCTRLSSSP